MKVQPLLSLDLWNIVFTMITLVVLFFILKKFFFQKVRDFIEAREKSIVDALENADETSKLADEKLATYEEQIAGIESEGREIIKSARDTAKAQAKEILGEVDEKAKQLLEHSQREIRREQFNARKELQGEVSALAMMAAEQIMEKELTPEGHEEIVEKIIKEAEDKPWS